MTATSKIALHKKVGGLGHFLGLDGTWGAGPENRRHFASPISALEFVLRHGWQAEVELVIEQGGAKHDLHIALGRHWF